MIKKSTRIIGWVCFSLLFLFATFAVTIGIVGASFPRPYRNTVKESGLNAALVYAVMKAESNFNERAVSKAGAVGIMQILPSTAEFICSKEGIEFQAERLQEGDYNVEIGCKYLQYLLKRFSSADTAICAYNAGEGTVLKWLNDASLSRDGKRLTRIPYAETRGYLKKIRKFRKIYEILY